MRVRKLIGVAPYAISRCNRLISALWVASKLISRRVKYHSTWRSLKLFRRNSAAVQARPIMIYIRLKTLKRIVTHWRHAKLRSFLQMQHIQTFEGRHPWEPFGRNNIDHGLPWLECPNVASADPGWAFCFWTTWKTPPTVMAALQQWLPIVSSERLMNELEHQLCTEELVES